ncbi:uncharacterized protein PG998_012474 [Apiospora kogelbergensis]|uniref:uncharacterized protein n=1 Tax=Apiospora kogelbergensis TaxID=1337665 RepID=UPI00312E792E
MVHHQAVPPLTEAVPPGETLNNYNPTPSTPLEIGLIVGVIAAVGLSAVALFFWRSRKNKALVDQEQQKEDAAARVAGSPTGSEQHHVVDDIYHGHPVHERGGVVGGPPVPPSKDERRRTSNGSDVIHNTSGITIERLSPRPEEAPRTPTWSAWGHRNGGYNGGKLILVFLLSGLKLTEPFSNTVANLLCLFLAEEHEIVTRV